MLESGGMRSLFAALLPLVVASCSSTDIGTAVGSEPPAAKPVVDSDAGASELAAGLVERALGEGRAYEMLRELTTVAPHRLSGSEGAEAAVAWAEKKMLEIGLVEVRRERCVVPRWVRGDTEVCEIVREGAAPERLDVLALGGSVGTGEGGISGEVVVVRGFDHLHALGEEVRGKIVLFNQAMPRALLDTFTAYRNTRHLRNQGAGEAGKLGAIAVLVRSMTTRLDDVPHTGAMRYPEGVGRIPAAAISTLDAERIAKLAAAGPVRVRLELDCKSLADVESANVVGEIRGTQRPEEVVVIGGHLDAWDVGQGAHDDGAGCVHCLEAARLILASGIRPKRTVRVVLFMNEENGLRGALAYETGHVHELRNHVAAIESDRGGFDPRGFATTLRGTALADFAELLAPLRRYDMGALNEGAGGADIGPLAKHGVALFGLVPTSHRYFDYHHSDRDRLEAVNERELALGAAAVAFLATRLANDWRPAEQG